MDVHADEGRPHVTRSEIKGRQTSECRPACRLDRRDPFIVDEAVDKRRAVAIESRLRPVGQEADRNAGLPDGIRLPAQVAVGSKRKPDGAVSPHGHETPPADANNAMVKRDGRHRAAAAGSSVPMKSVR
jgi:hypothetical protein